jgi:hypothetical protein
MRVNERVMKKDDGLNEVLQQRMLNLFAEISESLE